MQTVYDMAPNVRSKEDFLRFIEALILDLKQNSANWENNNLEKYLAAIHTSTEDIDGYYKNFNLPIPENINWNVFAHILITATIYE